MDSKEPVCLIIPPSVFLLDERVFVNLGILKIAAVLEQTGYEVDILDFSGIKNYVDALKSHLLTTTSTVFGITATTPQMPQITRIISLLQIYKPLSKIILGGPHVSLVQTAADLERSKRVFGRASKELLKLQDSVDILVSGDGEKAIFAALDSNAPKMINANNRESPYFLSNEDFDKSVFPARHLVDLESYHYTIDGFPATSVISQLGCPFSCGFCGGRQAPCLRIARRRSIESVVNEIQQIYETYGYTGYMFYDDELNVNPHFVELLEALTDLQDSYNTQFHFRGFVKSELFNEKQAKTMYKAGFRWILSGFESGSPRILQNIHKRATVDDNTRCVNLAKNAGLKVKALMSIGHPGESPETLADTKKWILQVKPEDFDVTIITPYPGTAYYDQAVEFDDHLWVYTIPENGDRLYSVEIDYSTTAMYYKGDPANGYQAYTYTDYLSSDELVEMRNALEKEIREKLNLPFNHTKASIDFEHSMGQTGVLPEYVLKSSGQITEKVV
jgi:radical SAM superfamily enzyme YgiQ (UPF0313 family)